MKARKRFLSVLLGAAMTLTMTTAVFAAEEAIGQPPVEVVEVSGVSEEENGRPIPEELPIVNEEDMVQAEDIPVPASTGYSGTGTKTDPYLIYDAEGFVDLAGRFKNYIGEKYVRLEGPIDLTGKEVDEWSGFINYFEGDFDGNNQTISNIPENCYLIYATHNANIHDLTLELNGKAGTLVYYSFRVSKTDGSVEWGKDTMENITVKSSTPVQLRDNSQANYAPFLFASGPYFTMKNCKNYADINGSTYASAFYGYYPLPASGYPTEDNYINFISCENHGNINLRYAGLFFGNPTGLRNDRHISFSEVKNYGEIRGTATAHFYCSDAGANDYFTGAGHFSEMEDTILDPKNEYGVPIMENNPMRQICDEKECPHFKSEGTISSKKELTGLGLEVVGDENKTKYFKVKNTNPNYKYEVTVFHYVSIFLKGENDELIPDGTARVTITEEVTAEHNYTTTDLKDLYLHDGKMQDGVYPSKNYDAEPIDDSNQLYFYDADMKDVDYGYWLDSSVPSVSGHYMYINHDQKPAKVLWEGYVSAYDSSGKLMATAELTRQH